MSQILSPNQDILDAFLSEIGYETIAYNLPAERKIVVDLELALSKITDADGLVWVRDDGGSSVNYGIKDFEVFGVYRANLRSKDQNHVRVEVYATKSGKAALDLMLKQASLVTTLRINDKFLKHPACFADFCLEGKYDADKEARFVYGDKYVHVLGRRENNTKSVIPLAKTICQILRTAERQSGASARIAPALQLSLTRPSLKVGETITISVDTTGYPSEEWEVDLMTKGDNLDYVDGVYGREEYKAISPGVEKVKAVLINKRTLQFAEVDKEVRIEP